MQNSRENVISLNRKGSIRKQSYWGPIVNNIRIAEPRFKVCGTNKAYLSRFNVYFILWSATIPVGDDKWILYGFCWERQSRSSSSVVYAKSSQSQQTDLRITRPSLSKEYYEQESLLSSWIHECAGMVKSVCIGGFLTTLRYIPIKGWISYMNLYSLYRS